jgi:uncharacterized NAD(P)/FAD-binding protein YdhS
MPQFHINHAANEKVELPLKFEDANLALSEIFHKFVIACKNSADWRLCFDAFRPLTQNFWMALDTTKKKRFMRHCFRLWNIHRHRCPESQYLVIEKMIKSGQIIFSKTAPKADHIINCSGFDYAGKSGLINSLIDNNIAVEDELNLGIKSKYDNFYIMGGLNFGSLFEITAVPDIAPEARQVAKEILLRQI